MSLSSFLKNFHGYQLSQAFIVFMCRNCVKNFHGCEVICKKRETFTTNNKQYTVCDIWAQVFH